MTPIDYESPIPQFLLRGEDLLWVGRPRQGFFVRWWDPRLLVFGGIGLFFALRWAWRVALWSAGELGMSSAASARPSLLETALVAGAAALAWFTLDADARRRRAVWYGVTDQRILFAQMTRGVPSVIGIAYDELGEVTLRRHAHGTGTLGFTLRKPDPYMGHSDVILAAGGAFMDAVPAAAEVHDLIRDARERAPRRPPAQTRPYPVG